MSKRKLTLMLDGDLIKTLKVKAIQYDTTVSELVEVLARLMERDKKLAHQIVEQYKIDDTK